MIKVDSDENIELNINGTSVVIDITLYERLQALSKFSNLSTLAYIKNVVANTNLKGQYENLKPEALIVIKLYNYCLRDCVKAEKTRAELQKE